MTFAEAQEIIRQRWPKEYVALTFEFSGWPTDEKTAWRLYIASRYVLTDTTWDDVVAYLQRAPLPPSLVN